MRYSANLNIIIKAIEKSIARLPRDFSELENLQTNPQSAIKFSNSCYKRIKEILIDDLRKFRPDYNIIFSDGEKIINNQNAEYNFVVFAIDGMISLSRGIPDFTTAIAIEHIDKNGKSESISVAINKSIGSELYYCEKGFGSYLNSRRIRVSRRSLNESNLISVDDFSLLTKEVLDSIQIKNYSIRNYGARSLEIAYLSSGRFDASFITNADNQMLKPFLLLVKEAGGIAIENDKFIFASNGLIKFK